MRHKPVVAESTRFAVLSREGLPIRGVLERPARCRSLVVLSHGFKGFSEWGFFPWLAHELVERGHAVCRFNFSRNGVGESLEEFERLDLFADDTYSRQLSDLECVVEHLASMPETADLPVILFGHSRGGAIAILGASRVRSCAAVVTWSAISNLRRWDEATIRAWRSRGYMEFPNARTGQLMRVSSAILDDLDTNRARLEVRAAAESLGVPILVVHGSGDETVPVDEARIIASAAPDSSLMILHDASHTFGAIHPLVHLPDDLRIAARVTGSFITSL